MMFEAENLLRISDNTMKITNAVKNTPPTVNPTDDHDYNIKIIWLLCNLWNGT